MSEAPPIRVRMTPEGMSEVSAALRQVQREATAAAKGAEAVDLIRGAVGKLGIVLGALGFVTSIAGLVALGKNAINSSEDVGKLGRLAGASAENISALQFAAKGAGVGQETLRATIVKTSDSLGQLNRGAGDMVDTFAELGLTAQDFAGKDTVQAIDLIAARLAKLPDGWKKTEIERRIFGRGVGELAPLLNALSAKGFEKIREEARATGALFGDELVSQATKFNDNLHALQTSSGSLVRQFVGDLLPSLNDIAAAMIRARNEGAGVFGTLYEGAQKAFQAIYRLNNAGDLNKVSQRIVFVIDEILRYEALESRGLNVKAQLALFRDELAALQKKRDLLEGIAEIEKKPDAPGKTPTGAGSAAADDVANFNAAQAKLNDIIKRAGLEQIASVQQVAKDRRDVVEKGAQAEEAALKARLVATSDLLSSQQQIERAEIGSIARRVAAAQSAYRTDIALADARANALTARALRQFADDGARAQLITLIDRQAGAQRLAAGKTLYDGLIALNNDYLNKYKSAQEKIKALDKELTDSRKQTADFVRGIDEAGFTEAQKLDSARKALWENEARLRDAVLSGDVAKQQELRAEAMKLAEELKRLGDPATAKQGAEEAQRLFELGAAVRTQAAQAAAKAAEDGAAAVKRQLAEISLEVAKLQASLLLEVKIGPDQESLRSTVDQIREALAKETFDINVRPVVGAASGGAVQASASGGPILGVSPHPRADNILIRATAGEYMQPVPAVRHYGTEFMDRIRTLQYPRFAQGGPVGGAAGTGDAGDRVTIDLNVNGRRATVIGRREAAREIVAMFEELKRGVEG